MKLFKWRIRDRNLIKTLVGIEGVCLFSNACAVALISSLWGMLVYKEATSIVTRMEILGTLPMSLIFPKNALVSLINEGNFSAIGCR